MPHVSAAASLAARLVVPRRPPCRRRSWPAAAHAGRLRKRRAAHPGGARRAGRGHPSYDATAPHRGIRPGGWARLRAHARPRTAATRSAPSRHVVGRLLPRWRALRRPLGLRVPARPVYTGPVPGILRVSHGLAGAAAKHVWVGATRPARCTVHRGSRAGSTVRLAVHGSAYARLWVRWSSVVLYTLCSIKVMCLTAD